MELFQGLRYTATDSLIITAQKKKYAVMITTFSNHLFIINLSRVPVINDDFVVTNTLYEYFQYFALYIIPESHAQDYRYIYY